MNFFENPGHFRSFPGQSRYFFLKNPRKLKIFPKKGEGSPQKPLPGHFQKKRSNRTIEQLRR